MKRLHQLFRHDHGNSTSIHWKMLKEHVLKQTKLEPFDQVDDIGRPGFRYLPSVHATDRFEILEGDVPYEASAEWVADAAAEVGQADGPVEVEIAGFMLDPTPQLGVLIGGMGSGKSTTLRQLAESLRNSIQIQYLNCDKLAHDPHSPPPASELLVKLLNPLVLGLIKPDEEFGACWNWAFDLYGQEDRGNAHGAVQVLGPAVVCLRNEYGSDWMRTDDEAIRFRRQKLHEKVCASMSDKRDYIALLLDYYLSVKCDGRRNRLCVVLDNIDPFTPRLQRELLLCVSQLQLNAQCKVMLAMRPLTYSLTYPLTPEQRANRVVKAIQHIGPPTIALIEDRVVRLIESVDFPALKLRVQVEGAAERDLNQDDFKKWVRQVIMDIKDSRSPGGHRWPDPSASEFIEGLCNNSLRNALLVAEKIFGSPNLPMVLPDNPPTSNVAHTTILKNHEIIRAVLLGKHAHFIGDTNRVTDNIFDLGDTVGCVSLTCKFRLLKELAQAPGRGILTMEEMLKRMRAFGYDDEILREAVNGIISQVKRLAWSDLVVSYQSLREPIGSRLSIARAGRFYVDHAIYSLEYVQEVHVDVLLPEQLSGLVYSHRGFSDRVNSLYKFLRHLHEIDLAEVKQAMTDPSAQRRYYETYGAELFSTAMARALERQVTNIGNSMLRRLRSDDRARVPIEESLTQWSALGDAMALQDHPVVELLGRFAAH